MPKRDRWSSDEEEEEGGDDGQVEVAPQLQPSDHPRLDGLSSSSEQRATGGVRRAGDESLPRGASPSSPPMRKVAAAAAAAATAAATPNEHPPISLLLHNPLLDGCRSVYDSYERLSHLDEGTYGVVWKARDLATDEIVALKQIKFDDPGLTREGFPISALREIGVLLSLSHECIVTVREMVVGSTPDKVYMVMECMEMDLQAAMSRGRGKNTTSSSSSSPFAQSEVKFMMHQLLSAMSHVHSRWFVHRDVKTSNVLVHKTGRIALCDFGLARKYEVPHRNMTQMVVTMWYRSPELLFGESVYGPEIDMWR